jgi:hypothetical protein
VKKYLEENFDSESCTNDIKLLIEQVFCLYSLNSYYFSHSLFKSKTDCETNENFPIINENISEKTELIDQLIKNIFWQMDNDRKTKALKQLQ